MSVRLAIIASHPVQYHIPWYQNLAKQPNIYLKVYYALLPDANQQGVGFNIPFQWDIPLLDGYEWELLPNALKSPSLNGFFASSTPKIAEILARDKINVAIFTGWNQLPLLQALWACIKLAIPKIVRGESNALKARPYFVTFLQRQLLSKYDAVLAIGKANREFYLTRNVNPSCIFDCPYFIENERFKAQVQKDIPRRSELRSNWGIPQDHTCFIYAGKLISKKRISDLLKGFQIACQKKRNMHLLIVGMGELMEEARKIVAYHSMPVTFAGFLNQTEMTRAYASADCLVLPSDYGETWGLVVNEAMVCGLPAIVSDRVGCGPDLVEEGVTGSIFSFGNVSLLAERMLEFASNRERLIQMGKQAQLRIQSYSVEKAVEGTLQAIDYIISKHDKISF